MHDRILLRSGLLVLAIVGCAVSSASPVMSPDAPVADDRDTAAAAEPAAAPAHAAAEVEPAEVEPVERSYVPDEAIPLGDEVIGHVGLPCGTPADCPQRARFIEKVSLHATAKGRERLAKKVPMHDDVVPEIANPEDDDGRVQIVCKAADYSAQVFVARSNLVPVTTRFAVATPTREGATADDPEIGLSLLPGARIEIEKTKGDTVKIVFEQYGLRGSGWLPKSAVGRFYRPANSDPRGQDNDHRELVFWRGEVPLHASPGGQVFATKRGATSVADLGETRDEHRLVAVGLNIENYNYAVGWIPQQGIDGGGVLGGIMGDSVEAGSNEVSRGKVRVSAGSLLRSRAGAKVGVVRQDMNIDCLDDCESDTPMVRLRCVGDFPARVDPQADSQSP